MTACAYWFLAHRQRYGEWDCATLDGLGRPRCTDGQMTCLFVSEARAWLALAAFAASGIGRRS